MDNLKLYFDPIRTSIVVLDKDEFIGELPIDVAYWLASALPKNGESLEVVPEQLREKYKNLSMEPVN